MVAVLLFVPISSSADDSAVYEAYYDILQERIEANGICEPSKVEKMDLTFFPDEPGVYYSTIIDMDNDSTPELVLLESRMEKQDEIDSILDIKLYNIYLVIYTYKDNEVVTVVDRKLGLNAKWGFCKANDGKIYLYTLVDQDSERFESVENSQYVHYLITTMWTPDLVISGYVNGTYVVVSSSSMHVLGYYINDKEVDFNEYYDKKTKLKQTMLVEFLENVPADDNTSVTLQQISANIPASYLECYYTPSTWAQDAVKEAMEMKIVNKPLQKKYNQPITRLEFCELAANYYEKATGSVVTTLASFDDTDSLAVRKMGGIGIINGVGDNKFAPNDLLTREQAAIILMRMTEKLGRSLTAYTPTFDDNNEISSWAFAQVGQAQATGVMGGVGNNRFDPQGYYTREQSIVTIMRLKNVQSEVTSVKLSESNMIVLSGGSRTLKATAYNGSEEVAQVFKWSSSDTSVATVDANTGKVTCKAAGTVTITATASNGVSDSCKITVPKMDGNYYCEFPITLDVTTGDAANKPQEETARIEVLELVRKESSLIQKTSLCINVKLLDFSQSCSYIYPEWKLYDANDNLVAQGTASCKLRYTSVGAETQISLFFCENYAEGNYKLVIS